MGRGKKARARELNVLINKRRSRALTFQTRSVNIDNTLNVPKTVVRVVVFVFRIPFGSEINYSLRFENGNLRRFS